MKLNVCCGNNKIPGYHNIDGSKSNNPDEVVDLLTQFKDGYTDIEEILFFHAIEHFEEKFHHIILAMFYNALQEDGWLYISYPEFKKVAMNYINNHQGKREFWKHTIYGLQRYAGDYHVSLMDSTEFVELLKTVGFKNIEYQPEPNEPWNTILRCQKGEIPIDYEELIARG